MPLLALMSSLAVAGACNSTTITQLAAGDGCTLNSECAPGLVCAFGRCSAACRTAADCMGGECIFDATMHALCQYPEAQLCEKQSDCAPPLACASDYRCRNICTADADCNVLGINGRVCAKDANGVRYCAVPPEVSDGTLVSLPPLNYLPEEGGPGLPDGAITDLIDGATSVGPYTESGNPPADGSDGAADAATPFMSNADAGTLGFSPSNFSLTFSSGPGSDSGAAPDVSITKSCTNCLGVAATTIKLSDGSPADLYVLNSLEVDPTASLSFTGPHPIILAILTTAMINGSLSVAADGDTPGPGGFAPSNPGPGAGGVGFGGSYPHSNAGGGSYCGAGGSGAAVPAPAAPGGPTYGAATIQPLIGGSSGGPGPYADPGGAGGGAIQIAAGTSISVGALGSINAGGGGVAASAGGSGGVILLESPSITIAGNLAANGGGGSYGSGFSPAGANGTASSQPAAGSDTGGNGSAGSSIVGADGQTDDAGGNIGAGGGGAGWIRINTATGSATITGSVSPSLATRCATQGIIQ